MVRLAQISGTLLVTVVIVFLISAVVEANPIAANPASVDFGLVPLNTQITQPIDITVDAGYKVSIASGGLNDPFSFSFGTCPDGGNCTVNESFLPTSIGSFSDTLNLYECPDAGGNCLSVGIPLLGAGISMFAANPASVDFGLVPLNTQITQPIDITVDAGYKVSIASGGLNDPFSFSFGTCPDGGNCTVNESFLPTSIGSFSDTLNLYECPDAGGNCLSVGIPLLGAGVVETNPVPEPTSLLLLGSGLLGLAGYGRKKFFNKK